MTASGSVILDGRYELLELLGEGGMGQVFKARHTRLGKIFAIKSLRHLSPDPVEQAKFLDAFESEARTLAELDHPALAQVSDFFEADGIHYLVMEFVNGKTLSRVADLAPKLMSQRRVVQWAHELCDVLHYLHSQDSPVIVRDLKPDNVMIDDKRRLRLLDFGIAKRMDTVGGTRDIIKGMGTAEYAPLEQYGSGSTDQRSDIYAFGCTLYFLLTEIPPPPAWKRASEGVVPSLPSQLNPTVTPQFEAIVLKMMALRREDRYQNISEVRTALDAISGDNATPRPLTASPISVSPQIPPLPPMPPENPKPAWMSPPVPDPPVYASDDSNVPSQRYGLPGTELPHSRIEIKPMVYPASTGRIPHITVLGVRGLRRYATPPQAVRCSPSQPLVAVAGRYLHVWDIPSGQLVAKLWSGEQELNSLDFSFDGRFLATAETEGEIHQYDMVDQRHTAQLGRRSWGLFPDRVRAVCTIYGQSRLAVASDTSNIRIFDTRNGEIVALMDWHQTGLFSKLSRKTLSLASSRQGFMAAGGADGSLSLFESSKFELKERKALGLGEIHCLEFSADGQFLVVATGRGRVLLLKSPSLEMIHELKHPATALSVSFSHDLRLIATGASDCQIRLFHLNSGKELSKLSHHTGGVLALDFSSSTPSLVSAGNDRRLFVTDLQW